MQDVFSKIDNFCCGFVNDVRPKKRKSYKIGRSVLLTEGGRSPTEVRKIKRFPFPAAFDWEISIQEQPSECYWSDTDTASSGFADLRRSKN